MTILEEIATQLEVYAYDFSTPNDPDMAKLDLHRPSPSGGYHPAVHWLAAYINQLSEERVREAMRPFYNALNDPGANPQYHAEQVDRLRREWPILYHMLASLNKPQIFGMPIETNSKVPEDAVRFDHPDGRSEGFVLDRPQEKKMESQPKRVELEAINERIWDLRDELHAAELAKAAIMNKIKEES